MSRFLHSTAMQIARMSFALAGGMLLTLVALANSAQAGCGDYVFVRNASGQLVRASNLMKDRHPGSACTGSHCPDYNPQLMQTEASTSSEESRPLKLPCQGPNCSDRSQLPAAPVPPPAPQRGAQESTALLLQSNHGDDEAGARFSYAPSNSDHELHYPQSIFHPPR